MAEWLVEHGIGESRAILLDDGRVLAAKLRWPGELFAGKKVTGKLVSKRAGTRRGTLMAENGLEVLVDRLPATATEGELLKIVITRAPIAERGRLKRAQGRLSEDASRNGEALFDPFFAGREVRQFDTGLWDEVWEMAWSGEVEFAGGSLFLSATPAMTLIDVDGEGSARGLSLAAVPAIGAAISQLDVGGSIGIDFPSVAEKAARREVDEALGAALVDFPHERTAMNGFGFVQVVARLEGPSLLQRIETSRVGAAARMALRRAERLEGGGTTELTVHPALKAKLRPAWLDELAKRTGRPVDVRFDPAIALSAGHAQIVGNA